MSTEGSTVATDSGVKQHIKRPKKARRRKPGQKPPKSASRRRAKHARPPMPGELDLDAADGLAVGKSTGSVKGEFIWRDRRIERARSFPSAIAIVVGIVEKRSLGMYLTFTTM